MSEIIKSSLEGIRDFADVDTVFGRAITTHDGVTIIPVSKITVGFAGGGVDLPTKKLLPPQTFSGGSGTGISVTPVAFLTVKPNSTIDLIPISGTASSPVERALELIESSPDIIQKLKNTFSG